MAFIDSSELGHCPTAQLLIENEVPSRIAAKDGSVFDFSAEIADYAATRLGWTTLASKPPSDPAEIAIIAQQARGEGLDAVVLIGQGGSTQAPQTVTKLYSLEVTDEVPFKTMDALSPVYVNHILGSSDPARTLYIVSSKSGSTLEPTVLSHVCWKYVCAHLGAERAGSRFIAITDPDTELEHVARKNHWRAIIHGEPDVGGRYSVLSAVGLLPIAAAGISIDDLMKGAADSMERFSVLSKDNDAYKYAAIRNILYRKGKSVEILECYEPDFALMNEWYKQLFGESEGKDNKGLFPASCIFSTDLHSMGQFIQEGSRTMFETIVDVKKPAKDLFIDPLEGNFDGLNFLADQNMSVVNRKAMEGTILAHTDGGVPEVLVEVDDLSAYNVGYLIYFFWRACACSGYLLGVNPFNQPGVESYKKNMFALLGKPGYEGLTAELEAKLK